MFVILQRYLGGLPMPCGMTWRRMQSCLAPLAMLAIASIGCERAGTATEQKESRVANEFVVFTAEDFTIDVWSKPIRPPVTPGSTPSARTLRSEDVAILSV